MQAVVSRQSVGGAAVDLWRINLAASRDPAHAALLAPDELARAQRYLSPLVRQRFVTGRGLLRLVLADYLSTTPEALHFEYGPRGKPSLGGFWHDHPLCFNIAHSEDCLLIGVTWQRAIGVDVEYTQAKPNIQQIAPQFFSPAEVATLQRAPDSLKMQAFFNCWTRKEAYIKARGDGLAIPLAGFDVTLLPDQPPLLLRAADDDPGRWAMYAETLTSDYTLAVVVEVVTPEA